MSEENGLLLRKFRETRHKMAAPYFYNKDIRNFLTRGIVLSKNDLDPFSFAQDPTFLSFKVEFFSPLLPSNLGFGQSIKDHFLSDPHLINVFGHEGLLLPPKYSIDQGSAPKSTTPNDPVAIQKNSPSDYNFADSAEDYLYAIGSVNRIGYLRAFKNLLRKLQDEAPWYFQKITGTDALYTLDPSVNTRREGTLNFECLETLDMRVSMLADFYRSAAFDFERYREVLPYNLRTFSMRIHVFEMRNFNTSSGLIAGLLNGSTQQQFQDLLQARANQNIQGFGANPTGNTNNALGAGQSTREQNLLASQFDAISMQTYDLGLCEFDFYSQAPSYMEELTVVDVPQAVFNFKVKFGTVRKTGKYSFYKYLTDYVTRESQFPGTGPFTSSIDVGSPYAIPFYDPEYVNTDLRRYDSKASEESTKKIEGVGNRTLSELEQAKLQDRTILSNQNPNVLGNRKRTPRVGGLPGVFISAAESAIGSALGEVQSGIDRVLLGNAYDNIPSPAEASQALLGFFNPALGLAGGPGAGTPAAANPGNVNFDPVNVATTIATSPMETLTTNPIITGGGFDPPPVGGGIAPSSLDPLPVDTTVSGGGFDPLSVDPTLSGGGFEPLPVDTSMSPFSLDPLPVDTNVDGGGFDVLPTDDTLTPGGYEDLIVEDEVFPIQFENTPVETDISPLTLEPFDINRDVTQDPLEPAPKNPGLSSKSVNLEKNEQPKVLKNKSVGFERPPEQPQISPKNVYRRNK